MKIAIFIDPVNNLNHKTDSTLYIYQKLRQMNIEANLFTDENLEISNLNNYSAPKIEAKCFSLDPNFNIINQQIRNMEEFDAIMLRQNPPVNTKFITNLQILSTLQKPKIINNPQTILKYPEKFIPLAFPNYIPQTIITRSSKKIIDFVNQNKNVVLKSIHGYGGNEVILVSDSQHDKIYDFIVQHSCIIAQEFLPQVENGDKRALIINGKLVGTLRRIPQKGSILANMVQGASGHIDKLNKEELKIVDEVSSWLVAQGIFFAGLDLIDGKLIEVNITCPTGLKTYSDLSSSKERDQLQEALKTKLEALSV